MTAEVHDGGIAGRMYLSYHVSTLGPLCVYESISCDTSMGQAQWINHSNPTAIDGSLIMNARSSTLVDAGNDEDS
jgi:hypothetical protein